MVRVFQVMKKLAFHQRDADLIIPIQRFQYSVITKPNNWRKIYYIYDRKIEISENKLLNRLGKKWYEESSSPEEIISKAEIFFKENRFRYSFKPGMMRKKILTMIFF